MKGSNVPKTTPEQNKALVMEAFDTLFKKRDYAAPERFWSPDYIQHSDHIAPGRDGLFNLIKSLPVNWIAADIGAHSQRSPRRALGRHSG
jgi:hypothetical protein